MNFASIYFCIGLVWTMILIVFGNLIGMIKEKGAGIGRIIYGCIISIVIWPYTIYIAIKEVLSNH